MVEIPDWLSATLASDAAEGQNVLPLELRPIIPGTRVVGPALVVLASQDDNQVIRHVLAETSLSGQVLVVSGHGRSTAATIGGLIALELKQKGCPGVITDGLVRDSAEIRALDLPVWCRGFTPMASNKANPGVIGSPIRIGNAVIHSGDLVIADDDGVVIWPSERLDEYFYKAKRRFDSDQERLRRLRSHD